MFADTAILVEKLLISFSETMSILQSLLSVKIYTKQLKPVIVTIKERST